MWGTSTLRTLANEDLGTLAENDPLTGYEPNDRHISETTDIFIQESFGDNRSLYVHDLEYDDYTIGMALSSPLFTRSEQTQRAVDKLIILLTKVCRPVSRRLSVMLERSHLLLLSLTHQSKTLEKIRVAAQKMSKSGFIWNDRESRFSLVFKQRFKTRITGRL